MKKALIAGLLALALGSTSCLGPDHAYNSVKQWNVGLAEDDSIIEVVFLGLLIIPVYPIALLADIVVFNTIGYWTPDNPIKDPGQFEGFSKDD